MTPTQQIIQHYTALGWQVVHADDAGVSLRKPKQWSSLLLILGLVGLVAFGAGLILLLLAVIDYALKSEQTLYVTPADIADGVYPMPAVGGGAVALLIIVGFIMAGCTILFIVAAMQNGGLG